MIQYLLHRQILACLHPVDLTLNVKLLVTLHLVHVYRITLERLPIVDRNVLSIPNAPAILHVLMRNVEILVQALAVSMQFALFTIMFQSVRVLKATKAMHFQVVHQNRHPNVSFIFLLR